MKISGINQFNISGLCKVEFTLAENVNSISFPDDSHQVSIELKSGFEFDELYFTKTAEDSVVNPKQDSSGIYYDARIKLINPRLEPAKAATFKNYEQRDLIFVLTDNNGYRILIGSEKMPARMKYKLAIPGSGRNQRAIDIDAIHDVEPYFVKDEVVILGGGFSSGFSSGFRIS
jgi:hypothetical protein